MAKVVLLRHDVDLLPGNSLVTAQMERGLGIRGTYFFRAVPESFDVGVVPVRTVAMHGCPRS